MIHSFDQFELDTDKVELRVAGKPLPVEPQVFALLRLLVENRERMVSKEEIIEKVWDGRFISDSAVASRIKSARQALGDDGRAQRFIKTIHGSGFRFVANVEDKTPPSVAGASAQSTGAEQAREPALLASRPSIAVLPFRLIGVAGPYGVIADALPYELITQLSRLRWLFVIARASSFQFRDAGDIAQVRTALNVRYCLSGVVEIRGDAMSVSVELSDTQDLAVIWAERFDASVDAVHEIRETIIQSTINALELQIPLNEARLARAKPTDDLDAWSAYHLALHHMYRFNKADNETATQLLQRAVALDPGFARAYAGLSFTHFQDAFLNYVEDTGKAAQRARKFSEMSLERDPLDPFGNFTMGRSFWLSGDLEGSLPWLDRANALNPNFAQGRYSRAFSETLLGRGNEAQTNVDSAMALSPLDPLRYGMLGVRAFSHVILDEPGQAAHWADMAARSPGAHVLIDLLAVAVHGLNGDAPRAAFWAEHARSRSPDLGRTEFFRAFPLRSEATRKRISKELEKNGF